LTTLCDALSLKDHHVSFLFSPVVISFFKELEGIFDEEFLNSML